MSTDASPAPSPATVIASRARPDEGTRSPPSSPTTPPPTSSWTPMDTALAFLAFLLAGGLRGLHLSAPSRWLDELANLGIARRPLVDILTVNTDLLRPPLSDLAFAVWIRGFGVEAGPARGLSVLCGALTAALVYWMARGFLSRPASLLACCGVVFAPLSLIAGREIRPDALLLLGVTAAWAGWFSLRQGKASRGHSLFHGVAVLAALFTHAWGALAILPQVVLDVVSPSGSRGAALKRWGLLGVLALPSLLWLNNLGKTAGPELQPPDATSLFWFLHGFAYGEHLTAAVLFALAGGAVAAWGKRTSGEDSAASLVPLLLAWLLLPLGVGMAVSHLGRPIIEARYATVVLPSLWLLGGWGMDRLERTSARWVPFLLLLLLGGITARTAVNRDETSRADWDGVAREAKVDLGPTDVLAGNYPGAWEVALGRAVPLEIPVGAGPTTGRAAATAAGGQRLLWLVGEFPERYQEATGALTGTAAILRKYEKVGALGLLVRPGGRPARLPEATLDPPRESFMDREAVFLYAAGMVRFPDLTVTQGGNYTVDVVARGTPAGGEQVRIDVTFPGARALGQTSLPVGKDSTLLQVGFEAPLTGAGPLSIRFLNDGQAKGKDGQTEDRNLWIDAVVLSRVEGGAKAPAPSVLPR